MSFYHTLKIIAMKLQGLPWTQKLGKPRRIIPASACPRRGLIIFILTIPSLLLASGGIKGKVSYTGERLPVKKLAIGIDSDVCGNSILSEEFIIGKRGELKNAVVYLSGKGLFPYQGISQDPAVVLTQEKCRFVPRVVFLSPGQDLKVVNNDGILHNFHTESHSNTSLNRAQPASMRELTLKFLRSEIFTAVCDVHSWMKALIVVKDNPYYTLTNDDGEFEIKDIPAGDYILHFFHEKLGEKKQVIQIKEGQVEDVSIKLGLY